MKTKISTTILLALSIQVMVNGQTQGTQTSSETNKSQNKNIQEGKSEKAKTSSSDRKILMTLDGSEKATSPVNKTLTAPLAVKTATASLNFSTIEDLLKLAEDLDKQAQEFRKQAKTKTSSEKNRLMETARQYDQMSLSKQLEATEVSWKQNLAEFNYNKITIKIMVSKYKGERNTLVYSYDLIIESEKNMKLAKEMREEAYAQATLAAKLGNMSNAEEKETLALNKQNEAINLLEKTAVLASNTRRLQN